MTIEYFSQLTNFEQNQDLENLFDIDFITLPRDKALKKQILRWTTKLEDLIIPHLIHRTLEKKHVELSHKIYVERKIYLIRKKAREIMNEDIDALLTRLEKVAFLFASIPLTVPTPPRLGLGAAILSCTSAQNYTEECLKLQKKTRQEMLINAFKEYTLARGVTWKKELKDAYMQLSSLEDITLIAKGLDYLQASQLITSALQDEEMRKRLPRLLVSFPYHMIENILINLSSDLFPMLNEKLKMITGTEKEWFNSHFCEFRKQFITKCNSFRPEIDKVCELFRDELKPEEIRTQHLDIIKNLNTQIVRHYNTLANLDTLFKDVIEKDTETPYLCQTEFPREDNLYLQRLSKDEEEIAKANGAPYGIIYRGVFGLISNKTSIESFLKAWLSDDDCPKYAEALHKLNVHTVGDLKRKEIFNKVLMDEFIGVKS